MRLGQLFKRILGAREEAPASAVGPAGTAVRNPSPQARYVRPIALPRPEEVLGEINARLGSAGKMVKVEGNQELRSQILSHPLKIAISGDLRPSLSIKATNTRGMMLVFFDPSQEPTSLDASDPWNQDAIAKAAEHDFIGEHVFLHKMLDAALERTAFESLPDSTQLLRLLEAGDYASVLATRDEFTITYLRSFRELDAPMEHLFKTVQIAGRSAEYLSSGQAPLVEDLGGLYVLGLRVDSSAAQYSQLVSCEYCASAVPLHYLRCNNCGAAIKLPRTEPA